jgi:4-amino-4-deoxy-L-arabinose transferase-like glycosyltransferase
MWNPIFDAAPTRQAQTAEIARNYYLHQNPFFLAELDHLGGKPVYQMLELPIIPYLASLIYRLLGGVHEWAYRLLTFLFSLTAFLFLYHFAKVCYGRRTALLAAIVYTLSPLEIIMAKSLQGESVILCFSVISLFFVYRWLFETDRFGLVISWASLTMAVLLKPYNLILLLPITYLFYHRYRLGFVKRMDFWIFTAAVPAVFMTYLQYQHYLIASGVPTSEGHIMESLMEIGLNLPNNIRVIFSANFGKRLYSVFTQETLNPFFFFAFIAGVFVKRSSVVGRLWVVWLAGIFLYFLILPLGVTGHGYHSLPALLPVSVLAGVGLEQFIQKGVFEKQVFYRKAGLVIFWLVALGCTLREVIPSYRLRPEQTIVLEAARKIDQLTERGSILVVHGENVSRASFIYYSNRKGHIIQSPDSENMEELIKKGSRYFITFSPKEYLEKNPSFRQYLDQRYELIVQEPAYWIFRLKK